MFDVLCLGILVADVVGRPIIGLPERGKLALVEQMELHSGGCATNTGIALARLGLKVAVAGKVGQDGFGDFMVAALSRQGIDTSAVVRDPAHHTSATMVLVDSAGERTFLHHIGANAALADADYPDETLARARILHVAGHNLMPGLDGEGVARLLRRARALGVATSLDTAWDATGRWRELLAPALPHLDVVVPSVEEARRITGEEEPEAMADAFLREGIGIVAIKMGERGCLVKTRERLVVAPAYEVPVVDATGAGDCFAAGFLAGLVKGWDLADTARLANATGAFCVQAIGATTGVRGIDETLAFMRAAGR